MSKQTETVRRYFQSLAKRDAEELGKLISLVSYVEHDPYVADGITGVQAYVRGLRPNDTQRIIRLFEDGSYVVAQTDADNKLSTSFNVFRLEEARITEHWRFSAQGSPPNKSAHTQLDGPTEAKHLDLTEPNKAFLREYYETFHIGGDHTNPNRWFLPGAMVRHEPGVSDGVQEFLADVQVLMQHRTIDRIRLLLGQGDFVFLVAEGTHETKPCLYIDLYRIEALKIVEHWGFPQPVPETSRNLNGIV